MISAKTSMTDTQSYLKRTFAQIAKKQIENRKNLMVASAVLQVLLGKTSLISKSIRLTSKGGMKSTTSKNLK